MRHFKSATSVCVLLLALSACTSVKKELGVGRNSPDEFTVVKRAPLTLPPDYALRPPGVPADAPAAAESADKAKTALLGAGTTPATKDGAAESAFLNKAGVGSANPDIRKQINEENGFIALKNQSVADKLIFWNDEPSPDHTPSSVVDPAAEAARIKKNKEEGKPVNAGDVPVIEKKSSTLDKIF